VSVVEAELVRPIEKPDHVIHDFDVFAEGPFSRSWTRCPYLPELDYTVDPYVQLPKWEIEASRTFWIDARVIKIPDEDEDEDDDVEIICNCNLADEAYVDNL